MVIKICDALCGRGKTSAAIKMMNENTDKKYIFVTQYLDEIERIKTACSSRGFVSPEVNTKGGVTKSDNFLELLTQGKNIACSHVLFTRSNFETREMLKRQGYTLVLDEVIDVVELAKLKQGDIELLQKVGSLEENESGDLSLVNTEIDLKNSVYSNIVDNFKTGFLRKTGDHFYYWHIPVEIFSNCADVYVLTYLFDYTSLRYFLEVHGIERKMIGVKLTEDGYEFCDTDEYDRRVDLRDKVHFVDDDGLKKVFPDNKNLSYTSCSKLNKSEKKAISDNVRNVFYHKLGVKSKDVLWATYKCVGDEYTPLGYKSGKIAYNLRASNKYKDRKYLAYCVDLYVRPWESKIYRELGGGEMNNDMYALSIMVQWVFRSALRVGDEIYLYVPSKRMKSIFSQWIENLAAGKDLDVIQYRKEK